MSSLYNLQKVDYYLIFQIIFSLFIIISIILSLRSESIRKNFKHAILWVVIFIFSFIIYTYQHSITQIFEDVAATIAPEKYYINKDRKIIIKANINDQFIIKAKLNDSEVSFLVDTGATNISLTYSDALNIGIHPETLKYNIPVSTANGITYQARTTIKNLTLGGIVMTDVPALVAENGLDQSLLGVSFLKELKFYQFEKDKLTLYY